MAENGVDVVYAPKRIRPREMKNVRLFDYAGLSLALGRRISRVCPRRMDLSRWSIYDKAGREGLRSRMRPCARLETSMRIHLVMVLLAGLVLLTAPPLADADFHLMQIEQVIGGVNGDTSAQAIQLRMRSDGQGGVDKAKLVVYDANGRNPVVVIDFLTEVVPEMQGGTILLTSPTIASHTTPAAVPDFTMTKQIPASYLAAGSLTFETNDGRVLWRLSWGGAAYKGPNIGLPFNDPNGFFGPPYPGPLRSTGTEVVQFQDAPDATSTTNAHDYALTAGSAVFTNVQGQSFTVTQ